MVKLKKYPTYWHHFVIILTFIFLGSCNLQKLQVTKISAKQVRIDSTVSETPDIEHYIKPYRTKIDTDLNTVLAYAPQNIDKSGKWQTPLGNLFADVTLDRCNSLFLTQKKQKIDFCLLNHGGIRSIIGKGNVTLRTAFELMPFENSAVVVALSAEQIFEIATYIIAEKKPHPISGFSFEIDENLEPKNIKVQGVLLDKNTVYQVVTSDYLANGGDNMVFFKKNKGITNLDYKLRNVLIDYFMAIDTIPFVNDKRIFNEKI